MSLSGAIAILRAEVPPVPPKKTKIHEPTPPEAGQAGTGGGGPRVESQNGEVSKFDISWNSWNQNQPLTAPDLAELFTRAANRFKLSPADLWTFLSLEDIEAIRTGGPEEYRALWAFAESRSRTGDRMKGGHDLPFPGTHEAPRSFVPVCCGDCAHFQPDRIGDGTGIGRCGKGIEPHGGPMYPKVTRSCRYFCEVTKPSVN